MCLTLRSAPIKTKWPLTDCYRGQFQKHTAAGVAAVRYVLPVNACAIYPTASSYYCRCELQDYSTAKALRRK
jgi:hypothetical protein